MTPTVRTLLLIANESLYHFHCNNALLFVTHKFDQWKIHWDICEFALKCDPKCSSLILLEWKVYAY